MHQIFVLLAEGSGLRRVAGLRQESPKVGDAGSHTRVRLAATVVRFGHDSPKFERLFDERHGSCANL